MQEGDWGMTYEEACAQWQNHSPWIRASKELIAAIQQQTKQDKQNDKFDDLVNQVGESK